LLTGRELMSQPYSIEINGELVGILAPNSRAHGFRFYSGIAPYNQLDGSVFFRPAEAQRAVRRISAAAAPFNRHASDAEGD
jgi:hypothetical protein